MAQQNLRVARLSASTPSSHYVTHEVRQCNNPEQHDFISLQLMKLCC